MIIYGYTISWMQLFLGLSLIAILVSFWRAHHSQNFEFNAFDLLMENGRVSKIAVAFMGVLAVTTWVVIDLQITGKMTEGYLTTYGAMWVTPLVAKVVFNKQDPTPPEK